MRFDQFQEHGKGPGDSSSGEVERVSGKKAEQDEVLEALRSTLDNELSPVVEKKMRGALHQFRERLEQHPYVAKLDRREQVQSPLYAFRYAIAAVACVIAIGGAWVAGVLDEVAPNRAPAQVVAGVSLGPVTLGMHQDEVLNKLGEPARVSAIGEHDYVGHGISVIFTELGRVARIVTLPPHLVDVSGLKTAKGISVGAGEDVVLAAYGKADEVKVDGDQKRLVYRDGLAFDLVKTRTGGYQVSRIEVFRPGLMRVN